MILSAQSIRKIKPVTPFCERTVHECGMSYGLSCAGYDIRVKDPITIFKHGFVLAVSLEHFSMPNDIVAKVADKSTWARMGLAVQNTIIEPGWKGYLTLELTYHGIKPHLYIPAGAPIAQILFMQLDEPTEQAYTGKYHNQPDHPVEAILETLPQPGKFEA